MRGTTYNSQWGSWSASARESLRERMKGALLSKDGSLYTEAGDGYNEQREASPERECVTPAERN